MQTLFTPCAASPVARRHTAHSVQSPEQCQRSGTAREPLEISRAQRLHTSCVMGSSRPRQIDGDITRNMRRIVTDPRTLVLSYS